MFVNLTLTRPSGSGPHTVSYRGDRYPIGGREQVLLRSSDIRAAHRGCPAHGEDYTLLITLDGQQYTIAETPAEIAALIAGTLPTKRSVNDHAVMGGVSIVGQLAVNHDVAGAIEHRTDAPQVVS